MLRGTMVGPVVGGPTPWKTEWRGERTRRGTDITDAAEYRVAISGSRPRAMPKPEQDSFGDVSFTRLSKGRPYHVSSPSRSPSGVFSRTDSDSAVRCVLPRKEGLGECECRSGENPTIEFEGERPKAFGEPGGETRRESSCAPLPVAVALLARRPGTRQRLILELPVAVQRRVSSMTTILFTPSAAEFRSES